MNLELQNKIGLTLVEMLIVVAVIALLATMVIGIAGRIDTQSKERAVQGTFALLEGALQEYYDYKGWFPEPNVADDTAVKRCEKLYRELNSIPDSRKVLEQISDRLIQNKLDSPSAVPEIYDLWGTVLDYQYDPNYHNFPLLISAGPDRVFHSPGPDGKFGTADDVISNDDISNR